MDFKDYMKYFWATVFFVWAFLILIGSVMPTSGIESKNGSEGGLRLDYIIHLFVFTVFAILFGIWRKASITARKKKELLIFLAGGSAYAGLTEGLQLFIEGRTFNPLDLLYNVLGILTGTLLAWLFIIRPITNNKNI